MGLCLQYFNPFDLFSDKTFDKKSLPFQHSDGKVREQNTIPVDCIYTEGQDRHGEGIYEPH